MRIVTYLDFFRIQGMQKTAEVLHPYYIGWYDFLNERYLETINFISTTDSPSFKGLRINYGSGSRRKSKYVFVHKIATFLGGREMACHPPTKKPLLQRSKIWPAIRSLWRRMVVGGGFEPPKGCPSRFTVCPRWPLGYPTKISKRAKLVSVSGFAKSFFEEFQNFLFLECSYGFKSNQHS